MDTLTFDELRQANKRRVRLFKSAVGGPAHPHLSKEGEPDNFETSDWTPDMWLMAVVGELGELANLLKKVQRGDFSMVFAMPDVRKEIADVGIYLDLLSYKLGVERHDNFADMRTARRMTDGSLKVTVDTALRVLTAHFGILANELYASRPSLHIGAVWMGLDRVADICGVDLGRAIRDKFNETSRKQALEVLL